MESVQLTTDDGHVLGSDVALPDDSPLGSAVVCHPHPLYGGNRHHPIVDAIFRALPPARIAALRLDFRTEHGGGVAEQLDVAAAVAELDRRVDAPIAAIGYSFGAVVALATPHHAIERIVAIAPPLTHASVAPPGVPILVLTPRHDQFCPPDDTIAAIAGWEHVDHEVVESADHFLAGRANDIADRTINWLTAELDGRPARSG